MARTKIDVSLINPVSSPLQMGANKITGLANGTVATDAAAFGQIFMGFQAMVQATSTTLTTTTSATFVDTNLSATITPTSSAHRIKITVSGTLRALNQSAGGAYATIARGSTDLSLSGTGFMCFIGNITQTSNVPASASFIDSPATTSPVTYRVRLKTDVAGQTVNWGSAVDTVMILEEIV